MKSTSSLKSVSPGFTLVELLVAIVILSLLVLLVGAMLGAVSGTFTGSVKRMDADSQARMVFDRMAEDFDKMIKRPDLDYIFAKENGNDAMFFFSEAPAYWDAPVNSSNASTAALIGYRINGSNQLERFGKNLTWDGAPGSSQPGGMIFLTYPAGTTFIAGVPSVAPTPASTITGAWTSSIGTPGANYTDGSDPDWHLLADSVYRLEIMFLLKDGTLSNSRFMTTDNPMPAAGSDSIQDVSAIVVALGILDDNSRKIAGNLSSMASALHDSVNGQTILQTWGSGNYLTQSNVSPAAASQIRIYQRYFYLQGNQGF